jgi:hypothetical protein
MTELEDKVKDLSVRRVRREIDRVLIIKPEFVACSRIMGTTRFRVKEFFQWERSSTKIVLTS